MANIVFITNVNECPFEIIEFVKFFIPILTKNVFVGKVL
jgi:hypothetical protein